jgi:hypothetical protein
MELEGLAGAQKMYETLEDQLKMSGLKVQTVAEAANQAIRATVARAARIERLQEEFNATEIDNVIATPATPESLAQLTQQIIEACRELLAVPQGWRNSKEFGLAVDCLQQMLVEYNYAQDQMI